MDSNYWRQLKTKCGRSGSRLTLYKYVAEGSHPDANESSRNRITGCIPNRTDGHAGLLASFMSNADNVVLANEQGIEYRSHNQT